MKGSLFIGEILASMLYIYRYISVWVSLLAVTFHPVEIITLSIKIRCSRLASLRSIP
jgi:hypothetical protein